MKRHSGTVQLNIIDCKHLANRVSNVTMTWRFGSTWIIGTHKDHYKNLLVYQPL